MIGPAILAWTVLLPAAACLPAVALDGDPALVEALVRRLEALGVLTTEGRREPGCPPLEATVFGRPGEIAVTLRDAEGRAPSRTVRDVEVAASWIESWARRDLIDPLLSPQGDRPPGAPRPIPTATGVALEPPRPPQPSSASVAGELGFSDDGTPWWGARAGWALGVGRIRPLAQARVATNRHHAAATQSVTERIAAELLLGAEVDVLTSERFRLRPGLAGGIGWLSSARGADRGEGCAASGAGCAPVIPDDLRAGAFSPRLEARVAFGAVLGAGLGLEVAVSGALAPFTRRDPILPAYAAGLATEDAAAFALARDPAWFGRASVGVTWEGP